MAEGPERSLSVTIIRRNGTFRTFLMRRHENANANANSFALTLHLWRLMFPERRGQHRGANVYRQAEIAARELGIFWLDTAGRVGSIRDVEWALIVQNVRTLLAFHLPFLNLIRRTLPFADTAVRVVVIWPRQMGRTPEHEGRIRHLSLARVTLNTVHNSREFVDAVLDLAQIRAAEERARSRVSYRLIGQTEHLSISRNTTIENFHNFTNTLSIAFVTHWRRSLQDRLVRELYIRE